MGVPFVGLVVATILISGNTPDGSDTAAKVFTYYRPGNTHHVGGQAFLTSLAVIFGLFFFAILYVRIRETSRDLAIAMFGGAVVFAAGGLLSAGALFALSDTPKVLSPQVMQTLNYLQNDVSYPFNVAGLAVLLIATGIWLVKFRELPIARTWGWLTVLLGLVAASVFLGFAAFIGMGIWVLVIGAFLVARPYKATVSLRNSAEGGTVTGKTQ